MQAARKYAPAPNGAIKIEPVTRGDIATADANARKSALDAGKACGALQVQRVDGDAAPAIVLETASTASASPTAAPATAAPAMAVPTPAASRVLGPGWSMHPRKGLVWTPPKASPTSRAPAPPPVAPPAAPAAPFMGMCGRPGRAYRGLTANPWAQSVFLGRVDQGTAHCVVGNGKDAAAREQFLIDRRDRIQQGAIQGALPGEHQAADPKAITLLVSYQAAPLSDDYRASTEIPVGEDDVGAVVAELLESSAVRHVTCKVGGFARAKSGWKWVKEGGRPMLTRADVVSRYATPKGDEYKRPHRPVTKHVNYNRGTTWQAVHNDRATFSGC